MVDTERREPDVGNRKDDSRLGVLVDRLYQSKLEQIWKRDRPPTGGPVCSFRGNDGHRVNRCPQVSVASPHLPRTGVQYRVKNKHQKLIEGPGNEQRSEREGQPLGPPGIKAPLTQMGVSAAISNGNPIGVYRGKIVSGATGRPIVRNFRHWKRRGNLDRGMRPAKDIRSVLRGNRNDRTWGVQKPIVTSLRDIH